MIFQWDEAKNATNQRKHGLSFEIAQTVFSDPLALISMEGFPEMTEEQRKRIEELAALPDSDIDTSDIPEWTDEDFANAIRLNGRSFPEAMKLYKVRKAPITARIDMDILEWLKSKGEGYQTRLNSILREAMQNDLRHHHSK